MKKKEVRKKKVKRRRNFFPTLIVIFLFWGLSAALVYFVDPFTFGAVPLFFLAIFFALFFTFSTLFFNTRRGLITTVALTLFLLLRYLGIGNILNLLLLAGVGISIDLYITKK
ncbi:hypothetical protein IID22_00200 [Patescibacteria group bacterium]|nr:hypothetical protein [Patescibacteria group bacterium]